jgi:hypothetical protein
MRRASGTSKKPKAHELEMEQELLMREQAFLADLRQFGEDLTVLRTNQRRVDSATELLESRMINILSFSTAVEMFHRLLNEREGHARIMLCEPIDDLTWLEDRVNTVETALEGVGVARSKVNEEIATGNLQTLAAIELLESQNVARRIQMQLRKRLQMQMSATKVAAVKFVQHRSPPDPRARARRAAQADLEAAESISALALRRQRELDARHRKITDKENALDDTLRLHQARHSESERAIATLRENLHENARLLLDVNGLREANAQLRETLMGMCDDGSAVRRERAMLDNAQRVHELNEEDAQKGRTRMTERTRAIAKRDIGMEQHRDGLAIRGVPIHELEEECQAKLQEILEIEEQSHQVELRLNTVLLRTRALEGSFAEGRGVGRAQRTIELDKVLALVTKHEDVLS